MKLHKSALLSVNANMPSSHGIYNLKSMPQRNAFLEVIPYFCQVNLNMYVLYSGHKTTKELD